jgi:aspartate 1-decarboxylase
VGAFGEKGAGALLLAGATADGVRVGDRVTVFASVIAAAVYLLLATLARRTAEPAARRRVAVQ